jgi:uncharacterized protein YdaU (DUF1376 family)
MPMFWEDYIIDAGYLKTVEHGAYLLLIGNYWVTGKPLPDDDEILSGIVKMDLIEWHSIRGKIARFFICEDGVWKHKRIERELAACRAISDKAKVYANKRWRKNENVIQLPTKPEREDVF